MPEIMTPDVPQPEPTAIPPRPDSGGVITSAWGQVVHDTFVVKDFQFGQQNIPGGAGFLTFNFPRAFAGGAMVWAQAIYNGKTWYILTVAVVGGTGVTVYVRDHAGNVPVDAVPFYWIAIGNRA